VACVMKICFEPSQLFHISGHDDCRTKGGEGREEGREGKEK